MGLLFNTNFHKGSYISRQGYVGTNTNGSFARTTAGLAWDSSATARIDYDTVSLGTTHTFVINYTRSTSGVAIFFTDTAEADGVLFLNSTDLRYRAGGHNISFSGSGDTLNSFNQLIITRSGTAVNCYLNNSLYDAEQTLGGDVAFDLDLIGHATTSLVGYLANIEVHDNIFTSQERSNAYRDFLAAAPKITEKLPGSLPEMKATSPNDPNLLVAYNCVPANGSLVDISNNEVPATLSGGIITTKDGISLDGINDFVSVNITLTPAGTVKTIAFRIKLATTTEMIYEGQSNDIIILANAGTLTASDYDTIYVDGVEAATVVAGQWHNVVITSSTVVDNNTPSIGYNSGTFNYGKFELEDFMVSSEEWDLTKVQKYHNSFAKRVRLIENFRYDPVGAAMPSGWISNTQTYIIEELATQDSVIKDLEIGTKYLKCVSVGLMATSNTVAYGTWEFDWYKGGTGTTAVMQFIASTPNALVVGGYDLRMLNSEAIQLTETASGVKFITAISYIVINTWYRMRITRTFDGEFSVYIKGGTFGADDWTLVVTNPPGNNPVTDTTVATSTCVLLSFGISDRITNIKIKEGVEQ